MISERHISIVISNYNKAATIWKCLEAAFSSRYKNFEVIVVDDHSEDNSVEVIKKFPCKLICLEKHAGASKARNVGAQSSKGDIIFFTDSDCLIKEDTLSIINRTISHTGPEVIIGGTYTRMPYDKGFFNTFQSVFIHYSETKNAENPDYIATHAMVINTRIFKENNGFPENFLPILEDVEFSHRLRKAGYWLVINPEIQVQHIFNFSLLRSIRNAIKKSRYWTMYSIKNRDLLADSGSSSTELKINVVSWFLTILLVILWTVLQKPSLVFPIFLIFLFNSFQSRRLLKAFYETKGIFFAGLAFIYYTMFYPLPVVTGVIMGIVNFLLKTGNPE